MACDWSEGVIRNSRLSWSGGKTFGTKAHFLLVPTYVLSILHREYNLVKMPRLPGLDLGMAVVGCFLASRTELPSIT